MEDDSEIEKYKVVIEPCFCRNVWFKRRVIEDVPLSEALKIQKDAFRSQDNKRAKRMGIYIYDKNGKCVASQIGPYFKRHTNEAP